MSDSIMWGSLAVCVTAAVITLTGTLHELQLDRRGTRRACDAEVHQLLTTRDTIELQRAAALVQAMRCDVGPRWTPASASAP